MQDHPPPHVTAPPWGNPRVLVLARRRLGIRDGVGEWGVIGVAEGEVGEEEWIGERVGRL